MRGGSTKSDANVNCVWVDVRSNVVAGIGVKLSWLLR